MKEAASVLGMDAVRAGKDGVALDTEFEGAEGRWDTELEEEGGMNGKAL